MPDASFESSLVFTSYSMLIGAGQTTTSGNTTLITPTAGTALHVHYCSYNPSAAAEVGFRFGSNGTIFLRNNLTSGSVISKDFGDTRFIAGAKDEALFLNQNAAVTTNWTVFYTEF